ncbi:hypothetical protein ELO32_30355, partial [Klebsiella pneumoniae]|nr:hypothetical protein [Klebsiella pneumoniae]
MPADKALLDEPNVATVTPSAPESYGIDGGQPLVLHGVKAVSYTHLRAHETLMNRVLRRGG